MRQFVLAAAALAAAGFGGAAQAAPSPTAIYTTVNEDDLRQVVLAHGDTVTLVHSSEDKPSVRAKNADGLVYSMYGTACDSAKEQRCKGIMMQVTYDDDNVTGDKVIAAARRYAAVATWWDHDDKTLGITRYVILDDGVTWANIASNLDVLLSIAPQAAEIAWKK